MSNELTPELIAQLFAQESNDPFLMLVTITHITMLDPIYLCSNSVNVVSRGNTFVPFPMAIVLAPDDGESNREIQMTFDNVSREIIDELRSVTDPLSVVVEMVLASNPDYVQIAIEDLKIKNITYDRSRITARLFLDSFLNVGLTAERYTPLNYPGLY